MQWIEKPKRLALASRTIIRLLHYRDRVERNHSGAGHALAAEGIATPFATFTAKKRSLQRRFRRAPLKIAEILDGKRCVKPLDVSEG
jgi:hypothetical protein